MMPRVALRAELSAVSFPSYLEVILLRPASQSDGRKRQASVVLVVASFIAVAGLIAAMVLNSISSIVATADRLDDTRAVQATYGAVSVLRSQLAGTLRDNAYWDDAHFKIKDPDAGSWISATWGQTTADYPLYDTAVVIDADGAIVSAWQDGKEIGAAAATYFGESLTRLAAMARSRPFGSQQVPVHFVGTPDGITLAGAAMIQPFQPDLTDNPARTSVLLISKRFSATVVREMSDTFNIRGLTIDSVEKPAGLSFSLRDTRGAKIGWLNWPTVAPGTKSYAVEKPNLNAAAFITTIFLIAMGLAGGWTIRDLRRSEAQARHRALHDPLTGLLNRAGLIERLDAIDTQSAAEDELVALHLVDLDGFKHVNDAWGHPVGDQLLVAVARRLARQLPEGTLIARLGGDDFAVVAVGSSLGTSVFSVGDRICEIVRPVFDIGGRSIEIGASVGVAFCPARAVASGELVRQADIALYRAKDQGRDRTVYFEIAFDAENHVQLELEAELRAAIDNDGIAVMFQPQICAREGTISGIEALARWPRPHARPIGPDKFIPIAERSGLIDRLGMIILDKALDAARDWPGANLSVNVSPMQLQNPRLVADVIAALERWDFPPERLTLELTEGVLISHPDQACRAITGFRRAGIKVALDDFGAGFASIGALRRFGFDRMKIDRSLVVALRQDSNGLAVLQATVGLAKALGMPVTAEGVETEEQALLLRLSGCDELQGYLFSRPISASDVTDRYYSIAAPVLFAHAG